MIFSRYAVPSVLLATLRHDWPDAESIKILQNIRAATKPTSRLLIHDYVLPPVARRLGRADAMQAPEPLLPSYGAANTRPFRQDINMLIQVNGKERTLDEFIELGYVCSLSTCVGAKC